MESIPPSVSNHPNILILNNLVDTREPMICRFCKGPLYEWSLRFCKITTSMSQKLQSYGFREPAKTCCPLYETKVCLKDYEPNKRDRQLIRRFNNYLKGKLSLEKKEIQTQESKEEQFEAKNPLKCLRDSVNETVRSSELATKFAKLEECLKHHILQENKKLRCVSSNLALSLFYKHRSTCNSMKQIQNQVIQFYRDHSEGLFNSKQIEIEGHQKGFINLFITDPQLYSDSMNDQRLPILENEVEEEEKPTKSTNLHQYFEEMIPLENYQNLSHSYEVRVERAVYSEEKHNLAISYFKHAHNQDYRRPYSFTSFLCLSPVYDITQEEERIREPSLSRVTYDKHRVLKNEGSNPKYRGTYHMLHYIDGQLAALGVLDILDTLLVSCQLLYHPKYSGLSFGRLAILREIEWARKLAKLGKGITHYSVEGYKHSIRKFRYKVEIEKVQILCPFSLRWMPFQKAKHLKAFQEKRWRLGDGEPIEENRYWREREFYRLMDKIQLYDYGEDEKVTPISKLEGYTYEKFTSIYKAKNMLKSIGKEVYDELSLFYFQW